MIKFTIPDFYENGPFNLDWIGYMKHYPQKFTDCKVDSVYGSFPLMIWAGGRQNKVDNINFVGLEDVRQIINMFNSQGVGVVLTCTNSLLQTEHLKDHYCNQVLEILKESSLNAVLVNSPILESYLRSFHHPTVKIYRSTTVCQTDMSDIDDYDKVVADYRLNNAPQLTSQNHNHRDKIEIMLNDTCPPYCESRKAHYDYISQYNLRGGLSRITKQQPWECKHPEHKLSFRENLKNLSTVTVERMREYHRQGFQHFKIVGREFNPVQLAEIYSYYMVKSEYQAEVLSWAIYRYSNITK